MPFYDTTPGSPAKAKLKKDTGGSAAGKSKSPLVRTGPSKWPITKRHVIVKVDPDVYVFYDRQKGPQQFLICLAENKGWEVKDMRRAEGTGGANSDNEDDDDDDYDKELVDTDE